MNSYIKPVERLLIALSELEWITDAGRLNRLSSDFSWFSPILKSKLDGKRADAAVRPKTEDEIRAVVAACATMRVPLTIRGSGSGNYGQTTPLAGGVVLDMTAYNSLCWIRTGVARAQSGLRIAELETQANLSGQEVRCMPSTYRSATIGGLFSGGFGGLGSINYGPLAAPGNVLGLLAMTIEADPKIVELRGAEALLMHHVWGTNGLVLEIEIGLAPAHPWLETLVIFGSFHQALAFADKLANAPGIVKREIAFFAKPVPDHLRPLADFLPKGCHAVLSLVAESSEQPLQEYAEEHGGKISYRKTAEDVKKSGRTLTEFTWNHTTLHALKVDSRLTYIQSDFGASNYVEKVIEMEQFLGGEVFMHVEFLRNLQGSVQCNGLQLVRFTSEERLNEIMAIHREHGVRINNPHVNTVEDGRAGGELPSAVMALKDRFDPHGLLNPGKLRGNPSPVV